MIDKDRRNKGQRDWQKKHPGYSNKFKIKYNHSIKGKKNHKKWRDNNKDKIFSYKLSYLFRITVGQYNNMLANQNGVCAICGQPETKKYNNTQKIQKLSLDHNHKTGKVRCLLCDRCNRILGVAQDSIQLLKNSIDYLIKFDEEK